MLIWRLSWGRIHLQAHSGFVGRTDFLLTVWLRAWGFCWLSAKQQNSSRGHLQFLGVTAVPCHVGFSNMAAYCIRPTRRVSSSSLLREFHIMTLIMYVVGVTTFLSLLPYSIVRRKPQIPLELKKRITPLCEYQEAGITGGYLGFCPPHWDYWKT